MEELWIRIETWLEENAPDSTVALNPGASEEEIQKAEALIGVRFPEDLRESYLRHNGQPWDTDGLLDGFTMQPLEELISDWKIWKDLIDQGEFEGVLGDPDPAIQTDWWNVKWIPISADGGGNHHCLDMAPAPGGAEGQVIQMWHDWEKRELIAVSFQEWLTSIADGLETGEYFFDEEYGIVRREESEEDAEE